MHKIYKGITYSLSNITKPNIDYLRNKKVFLKESKSKKNIKFLLYFCLKTGIIENKLFLDLDETLIHSCAEQKST